MTLMEKLASLNIEELASYHHLERLAERAETGEEHAEIARLEACWLDIHGPRYDASVWRDAEIPFALNH